MNAKLLLATMGFSSDTRAGGMPGSFASRLKGYVSSLFEEDTRVSPLTRERQQFEKGVREQFLKLKEKGLSISVFTL